MKKTLRLVLEGEVPAKKNMYRISGGTFYTRPEVKDWVDDVYYQVKEQVPGHVPIASKIALEAVFYIKRDKDLDNLLNGLLDGLQGAEVLVNDKQITQITASKIPVEKGEDPRTEIAIYPT